MLNWWFKKESPFQGLIGFGGGATGLNAVGAGGNWTPSGVTATGGTKVTGVKMSDNTPYTYHFFTDTPESPSSQTFSVSAVTGPGDVEYIVVAGGGKGGYSQNGNDCNGGGGGGGGGLMTNFKEPNNNPSPSNHPFYPASPGTITVSASPGSYPFTVGAGANSPGSSTGGDSSAFGVPVTGGGRGGWNEGQAGTPGGSGGGGGATAKSNPSGQAGEGNPGGADGGGGSDNGAGGGGGAGGVGTAASPFGGGPGGAGARFYDDFTFDTPTTSYGTPGPSPGLYLAGGGGGGSNPPQTPASNPGSGGAGGGGAGGPHQTAGTQGTDYTGGGGGGAGGGTGNTDGGDGGNGIIIVRYID